jgi:hypothetical protein
MERELMKKIMNEKRVYIQFLALVLSVGALLLSGAGVNSPGTAAPAQVVVEVPHLTPPEDDDICRSYWYKYPNTRGHDAYLTVNVKDTGPFNSAEWLAEIPDSGYYLVEAFIPAHPSIFWACDINKQFDVNTSNARYTVDHQAGSTLVSRDQSIYNNQWVSLGEYYYRQGDQARVHLTDQTGEDRLTRTVSFSAVRFTWVGEPPHEQYIPQVLHRYGLKVHLTSTWTTDLDGRQKSAFIPFEPMRIFLHIDNQLDEAVVGNLRISRTGTCPQTVVNEIAVIEPGETTFDFYGLAPDLNCRGIYTLTSRLTYQGQEVVQTLPYMVYISHEQAFDKCNIATVGQMQTWWNLSPYMSTNLYIGGVSRACGNLALTAEWVSAVSQQGWQFIPTWVGPQAPCSRYTHKISYIHSVAYNQGRDNADQAYAAAVALGFGPGTSIFADIENYNSNVTDNCRAAVSHFMNGWVERLHELGFRAGGYGGVCSSYISDWWPNEKPWSPANTPDEIWVAHWNRITYDPYAVVGTTLTTCLPNDFWNQNQRIKQYAGDHNETYGGITFNIDSNVLDLPLSKVQGLQAMEDQDELAAAFMDSTPYLGEFQLVSGDKGWAISNGQLFWTEDAGFSWKVIEFPQAGVSPVLGAHFLDELRGWVVFFSGKTGQPLVLSTLSGPEGMWRASSLTALPLGEWDIHSAYFDFINSNTGWLALKLATGTNFSLGELFRTDDGGRTWTLLNVPIGGPVRFIDDQLGWVSGGPGGGDLYETLDGGRSWEPVQLEPALPSNASFKSMPVFLNREEGIMTRTFSRPGDPALEILRTRDGGKTWVLENVFDLPDAASLDSPTMLAYNGEEYLVSPPASEGRLYRFGGRASSFSLLESASLPAGATQVEFVDGTGWTRTSKGSCRGQKPVPGEALNKDSYWSCSLETKLWKTNDRGRTWLDVTP